MPAFQRPLVNVLPQLLNTISDSLHFSFWFFLENVKHIMNDTILNMFIFDIIHSLEVKPLYFIQQIFCMQTRQKFEIKRRKISPSKRL